MAPEAPSRTLVRFRRIRFWAFALVGLVVAHDAVFIAEYGPVSGQALAATGHGYWVTFAVLASLLAGIPIVATLVGLARLRSRIALVRGGRSPGRREREQPGSCPTFLDEFLGLAPRLFLVITTGFVVQENLEHLAAGHGFHGLDVLVWPHHPLALPVLFGVSLLLAITAAWLRWRGVVLERRLAAARAGATRFVRAGATRAARRWGDVAASVAHGWLIARRLAGRAPPSARGCLTDRCPDPAAAVCAGTGPMPAPTRRPRRSHAPILRATPTRSTRSETRHGGAFAVPG